MKNPDRVVTWCLVLVAISFWAKLAWQYFTNQPKDSFFVGPAVAVAGLTMAIDMVLLLVAAGSASMGVLRMQVNLRKVMFKWPLLVAFTVLSYYAHAWVLFQLFPFLGPQ